MSGGALSIIEQKPLGGGPIALLTYHIHGHETPLLRRRRGFEPDGWSNDMLLRGAAYTMHYAANLTRVPGANVAERTRGTFDGYADLLEKERMWPLANAIRTWIFLRDVDLDYRDMVTGRTEFFNDHWLTADTRYIASTGIQGGTAAADCPLSLDALAIGGIESEQIVRLDAIQNMPPTIHYGVTFERGTAVRFGDRSHMYISGTASINPLGEVLFAGDPAAQTRRAIDNIEALLKEKNRATLADMACVIAYARNFHDRKAISGVLREAFGDTTPLVFAEAPVCRPGWLVELEGVALVPGTTNFPPFL